MIRRQLPEGRAMSDRSGVEVFLLVKIILSVWIHVSLHPHVPLLDQLSL